MSYQGKNVVGVWIDHKQAYIIGTNDRKNLGDYQVINHIKSKQHADHSSSEVAHHNKVAQEIGQMYEAVMDHLVSEDAIFISGPGRAQEELRNKMVEDGRFQKKEIVIGTSDHPTDNQRIAEIRAHFTKV
jgi:stalled ribosome rescue protein Dom34